MQLIQLLKSKSGGALLTSLMLSVVLIYIIIALSSFLTANNYNLAFLKKNSEIEHFLFSFRNFLSNPTVCYKAFCDNINHCPSLNSNYINLDITNKFLPQDKISSTITVRRVYSNFIKRTGVEHRVTLGTPFQIYPQPLHSSVTKTLTRVFANLRVDVSIRKGNRMKNVTNINRIFNIDIPVFFHLEESTLKMKGCYALSTGNSLLPHTTPASSFSLAYLCEQQGNRVWSFETKDHLFKCQPYEDCIRKNPDSHGKCRDPFKKNPMNAMNHLNHIQYQSFTNKVPFFNSCLWCN